MIDISTVSEWQLLGIVLYELKLKQIDFHQCLIRMDMLSGICSKYN